MRAIVGLICLTLTLALVGEDAHARKKKRRRHRANSRLLQSSTYAPLTPVSTATPAKPVVVEKDVPPPVEQHDHFLSVSLLVQGDVRYSPASVGLSLAYQLRLSEVWRLSAGANVALRSHRNAVEPHVGFEAEFVELGPLQLHGFLGASSPWQLMADTVAIAVAGRAELGMRWSPLDWLSPQAGLLVVVGPMVTPAHLRWQPYASVQAAVGARFGL